MVDGLVDIEEEDLRVVALHDIGLREIDDAPAVDKQKQLDLLIDP